MALQPLRRDLSVAEEVAEHEAIWPVSRKKGDKMVAAQRVGQGIQTVTGEDGDGK